MATRAPSAPAGLGGGRSFQPVGSLGDTGTSRCNQRHVNPRQTNPPPALPLSPKGQRGDTPVAAPRCAPPAGCGIRAQGAWEVLDLSNMLRGGVGRGGVLGISTPPSPNVGLRTLKKNNSKINKLCHGHFR